MSSAGSTFAQQPAFRHLSIDDGLSQNAVFSILQDSRGFMWFGINVQFVREQSVRGMSDKTYNPDEKRNAGYRPWLEYYNDIVKAYGGTISIRTREYEGTTTFIIESHV